MSTYSDISKPAPPLPTTNLKSIGSGVSLLAPLSRRGHGPGIILLVPDHEDQLTISQGVPSLLVKWAEEGYAVVEIQRKALEGDAAAAVSLAVDGLAGCEACQPKDKIGVVAYDPYAWNLSAESINKVPSIAAVAIYTDVDQTQSLAATSVPTIHHVAGKSSTPPVRSEALTAYHYPGTTSHAFATPFQPTFSYTTEALSHTRNLNLLKRHMGGPNFDLEQIWDEHCHYEFVDRSAEHTMSTMVQEPYVNHVPVLTGGVGREPLTSFYRSHFIFSNASDAELELVSRSVAIDRVIDEFIFKCTHNLEIDWLVPGIPPTGKKLEIPFTAVVNIRGDRLFHEHISWDQGTVLRQLGLMPEYLPFPYPMPDGRTPEPGKRFEYRVPVAGVETANKMRDRNSVSSNGMFQFRVREV
ncbi:hypothetical protein MGG_09427 [Pyricularia oryzae 70-15]|uniref:Carboxymethylenebutenolidase n=3 Tax=Pyricularia oryzae TaxID=318829 RepID=G4NHV1_PYRO7|nr:uncharacterized protein MGG_09427 [Pyricularia oryzae 70-15]EHA47811.1 hypothetical protein MGG_09427 [Pyricularia oryzae 70-15]ELQ36463.1 hypothetical protein OOU_Y34scaffold00659g2 [Pyricularia oryzae Y34]KAI7910049.1 hypothetical protein M9X92_011318 [Pyricularia oryzae]KAI7914406.1 hypothetical protein M0657_009491 [Pyricularia oryzae]